MNVIQKIIQAIIVGLGVTAIALYVLALLAASLWPLWLVLILIYVVAIL